MTTILLLIAMCLVCLFGPLMAAGVSGYNPLILDTHSRAKNFILWLFGSLATALVLALTAWVTS